MRFSTTSGSLFNGLVVIGTGAAVMVPEERWIGGIIILIGIFALLFDVKIEHGHPGIGSPRTLPKRLTTMAPQLLMIFGVVIFLVGLAWQLHRGAADKIKIGSESIFLIYRIKI